MDVKSSDQEIMGKNNLVMLFEEILKEYGTINKSNFKGNELVKVVTKDIPSSLFRAINIDSQIFKIKGSCGNGQPAEVAWISIFNKGITTTATKGLYLVFLLKADLSGMYLSLNQGFTYFKDKYGSKEGKNKIRQAASKIRNSLNTLPENSYFTININCSNDLGKGYEAGNIAGKYYSLDDMPNINDFIKDIKQYMICYEELNSLIGVRTVEQFYDYLLVKEDGLMLYEQNYIEDIGDFLEVSENSVEYKGKKEEKKHTVIDKHGEIVYLRNPIVASNALKIANYTCEINSNHPSFIRRRTGKNYTEPHHLIPMEFQSQFKYSLDVEENIVSLCSTCHNCIHYGIELESNKIIERLYLDRVELLKEAGLEISLDRLKVLYRSSKEEDYQS